MTEKHARHGSLLALTPLLVFLATYLAASLITGDFYRMPISVAFLAAAVYAVATTRRLPFAERIEHFSAGAANGNILLMIWIFILAGAFAESARSMGAVDATVNLTLHLLPGSLLPPRGSSSRPASCRSPSGPPSGRSSPWVPLPLGWPSRPR